MLSQLLKLKATDGEIDEIVKIAKRRIALVIGAGPSLEDDIRGLKLFINTLNPFLIAADGAADGINSACGFVADVIVSDLDSCSGSRLVSKSKSGHLFIHAHGDNIDLLLRQIPRFGRKLFGTTQVKPLGNVWNLGGITDGDRACFLAVAVGFEKIVLAGMNFGDVEGSFSRNKRAGKVARESWIKKMGYGKQSLEFLVRNSPKKSFINVTLNGVSIFGTQVMSYEQLTREFS